MSNDAMRTTVGVVADQRQAVIAEGPDAVAFLQGQISQDVEALAPGEASWSLVLHPQGKVSAWFRITRITDERFILDLDAGWADELLTRLNRFKLRTAIDISLAPWHAMTIVGPGADDVAVDGVEHDMIASWAGVPVRDVFGANLAVSADLPVFDDVSLTALRIEAGVPKMGAELDESTIPAAAGIVEQSVSFTKGCYTGQELVARIDSRGNNVPKRLLSLVIEGADAPPVGAEVAAGDKAVGVVTSTAWSPHLDSFVGLAYINRSADVGQAVTVGVEGGTHQPAMIHELPLVRG